MVTEKQRNGSVYATKTSSDDRRRGRRATCPSAKRLRHPTMRLETGRAKRGDLIAPAMCSCAMVASMEASLWRESTKEKKRND